MSSDATMTSPRLTPMRNAELPETHRIQFRMGVNLGDVIVASDDIYGHGVNLAARLESLAAPGGVCISADTWRHVRGAIAAEFVDLGEQIMNAAAELFAVEGYGSVSMREIAQRIGYTPMSIYLYFKDKADLLDC